MSNRTCIVVPVFNHGVGAQALVPKLRRFGLPVILVNDASDDACRAILHGLAAADAEVRVIDHAVNQGKGGAVATGLKAAYEAGFSHALQIDADGQHDAEDIPRFLTLSAAAPEAVIAGVPIYDDSVPRGRLIARYLTHVWVWIETLSLTIRDSMCGFRIYPLAPVVGILTTARLGMRMDFDPEILVRLYWAGVSIRPLPTRVVYPEDGVSHFRLWEDNWLITRMHTRLFFGMIWRLPRLLWRHFG